MSPEPKAVGSTPASPTAFFTIRERSGMKKWIGTLISSLLIVILGIGFVFGFFSDLEQTLPGKTKAGEHSLQPAQEEKEGGDADPYMLRIWMEIQRKLDKWLRRLNDRIEKEDVTRFGVRFLEMIRNILEWAKEKVDARVESYGKEKPAQKKGLLKETRREYLRFSKEG